VENELAALLDFEPAAVYAGMNLPSAISARAARLSLIYLLPTPGTPPYFVHNLAKFLNQYERALTCQITQHWKNRALNWIIPRLRLGGKISSTPVLVGHHHCYAWAASGKH